MTQKRVATCVIHKICDPEGAVTVCCLFGKCGRISCGSRAKRVIVIPSGWQQSLGGKSPHYADVSINKSSTGIKISVSWLQKSIIYQVTHTTEVLALKAICNLQKSLFSSWSFQNFKQGVITGVESWWKILQGDIFLVKSICISLKSKAGQVTWFCLFTRVSMST